MLYCAGAVKVPSGVRFQNLILSDELNLSRAGNLGQWCDRAGRLRLEFIKVVIGAIHVEERLSAIYPARCLILPCESIDHGAQVHVIIAAFNGSVLIIDMGECDIRQVYALILGLFILVKELGLYQPGQK